MNFHKFNLQSSKKHLHEKCLQCNCIVYCLDMWRLGDSFSKRNFPSHLFVILDIEKQEIIMWDLILHGELYLEPQNGNFNSSRVPVVSSLNENEPYTISGIFPDWVHISSPKVVVMILLCFPPRLVRMSCVMLSVSKDCSHLASALNVSMGGSRRRGWFPWFPWKLLESMICTNTAGLLSHDRCKIHKSVVFMWSENWNLTMEGCVILNRKLH